MAAACVAVVLAAMTCQRLATADAGSFRSQGAGTRLAVDRLLKSPSHLRLTGTAANRATFFFRVLASNLKGEVNFGMVAACRHGISAVLVYAGNGLPYAYCGKGLLVLVDARRPGTLDVYRGISPGLAIGGGPGSLLKTSFVLAPTWGRAGMIDLNLLPWVASADHRATQKELLDNGRQLVFTKGATDLRVMLSAKYPAPQVGGG